MSFSVLVGIFSDIHDNLPSMHAALRLFEARSITTLIFCGDFCSPLTARELGSFAGEIHCVFGNGDRDERAFARISAPNLHFHGEQAKLELGGTRLAATHYPFSAQTLARSGMYQAVFSGHTHAATQQRIGATLWLNPGEIMGRQSIPSCAIYTTETNSAEIIELE